MYPFLWQTHSSAHTYASSSRTKNPLTIEMTLKWFLAAHICTSKICDGKCWFVMRCSQFIWPLFVLLSWQKKNFLIFKSNSGWNFWVPFYAVTLMFESGRFRCGSYHNRVNDLFNLLTIHVVRCFERFISIFRLIQIFEYCHIHFGCQRELFLPTNIRRHWHPSKKNLDSFMTFYRSFFSSSSKLIWMHEFIQRIFVHWL